MKNKSIYLKIIIIFLSIFYSFFTISCEELEGNRFDPESPNYERPNVIFRDERGNILTHEQHWVFMDNIPFKVKIDCPESYRQEYKYRLVVYNEPEHQITKIVKDWSDFISGDSKDFIEIYFEGQITLETLTRYKGSNQERWYSLALVHTTRYNLSLESFYNEVNKEENFTLSLYAHVENFRSAEIIISRDYNLIDFLDTLTKAFAPAGYEAAYLSKLLPNNDIKLNYALLSNNSTNPPYYSQRFKLLDLTFKSKAQVGETHIIISNSKVYWKPYSNSEYDFQIKNEITISPQVKVIIKP